MGEGQDEPSTGGVDMDGNVPPPGVLDPGQQAVDRLDLIDPAGERVPQDRADGDGVLIDGLRHPRRREDTALVRRRNDARFDIKEARELVPADMRGPAITRLAGR